MQRFPDDFLQETLEVWRPLSREPLTMADAHEIAESMTNFFTVLARCAKERNKVGKYPADR